MRGYGRSLPVDGPYSHLSDFTTVLDRLAGYVADGSTNAARRDRAATIAPSQEPELHRPGARTAFRRTKIDVCELRTAS